MPEFQGMNDSRYGADNDLWAVTCYFNPARYGSRLRNYRAFRARLRLPLVAVELVLDGQPVLGDGDAERVVHVEGGDVMWQKERLLNIALQHLPAECEKVAWLDCDVIFERDDWSVAVASALDTVPLVQAFDTVCDLGRNASHDCLDGNGCPHTPSTLSAIDRDSIPRDYFRRTGGRGETGKTATGLAWAAWRELLESHGLYDACVMGSGDRAILCAALGRFDDLAEALFMDRRRVRHYLSWARPFHESIAGRISYVSGRVFHLWHGTHENRRSRARHREFARFGFDPYVDIALADSQAWCWRSEKHDMHQYVREYFALRAEDG
jgi:hypothetical protein